MTLAQRLMVICASSSAGSSSIPDVPASVLSSAKDCHLLHICSWLRPNPGGGWSMKVSSSGEGRRGAAARCATPPNPGGTSCTFCLCCVGTHDPRQHSMSCARVNRVPDFARVAFSMLRETPHCRPLKCCTHLLAASGVENVTHMSRFSPKALWVVLTRQF